MVETDPEAEKPPVLAVVEEAPDTQKKVKTPARHAVRTESPMAQFFTPLPLAEGGAPQEGRHSSRERRIHSTGR